MSAKQKTLSEQFAGYLFRFDIWFHRTFFPILKAFESPRPLTFLWTLWWPFPYHYSGVPPSISVHEILARPDIVEERLYYGPLNYHHLRAIDLFGRRDTPLRSLYRLFEYVCAQDDNSVMLEAQYFWSHSTWRLCSIPDPHDADPIRYAVLAGLVEAMVAAFNHKVDLGLRRYSQRGIPRAARIAAHRTQPRPYESNPSWTSSVPGLKEPLVLMPRETLERYLYDASFLKRNIIAEVGQLRNV